MGRYIIKLGDRYLEWSSVSDAPISYGMTLGELQEHIKDQYGAEGLRSLPARLERVEGKGTSAMDSESATATIWLNRAGPKESQLHRDEIEEFYVRRGVMPTARTLAAFRKGLPKCGPTCSSIPDEHGSAGFCEDCWGTGYVRKP